MLLLFDAAATIEWRDGVGGPRKLVPRSKYRMQIIHCRKQGFLDGIRKDALADVFTSSILSLSGTMSFCLVPERFVEVDNMKSCL